MSDSPAPASGVRPAAASRAGAAPRSWRGPWRERLDRLVGWARLVLWWERAWPALWLPLLGPVPVPDPVLARPVARSRAAFAARSASPCSPRRLPRSGRCSPETAGPRRGARAARPRQPASSTARPARSTTASRSAADPGTRALWDLHRQRATPRSAALRVATPRPDMARRDRFALRAAALVALVASAFVAGPEFGTRLLSAFDWRHAAPAGPALPRRWLDRPAALYPHPAADDRPRRRRSSICARP